jgi:competence protein ComEA
MVWSTSHEQHREGHHLILRTTAVLVSSLLVGACWAQVELNQATEVDLDGLRGVGPSLTRQVLSERQKRAFESWADLQQRIKGIGPKKAASLSDQGLRVQGLIYTPSGSSSAHAKP